MDSYKKLLYPAIVCGSFAMVFALMATLPFEFKVISTVSLLLTTLAVHTIERAMPYRESWSLSKDGFWLDFLYTMILFPVVVGLCQFLILAAPSSLKVLDLTSLNAGAQFIIGLLSGEFLIYWLHRWTHTNQILWRFHAKHHSVKKVYWMNSGTFNLLDLFFNFLVYSLPFAFFKTDPMAFEFVLYFSAVTGLMEHANIDFKAGTWNYLFNTAELHRWHHSVVVEDSQSNYGKALSVFDHLFGTFNYRPDESMGEVGIEALPQARESN